jgi:hypothetical protein
LETFFFSKPVSKPASFQAALFLSEFPNSNFQAPDLPGIWCLRFGIYLMPGPGIPLFPLAFRNSDSLWDFAIDITSFPFIKLSNVIL